MEATRGWTGLRAVVALIIGLLGATVGQATIPDAAGLIHGCYSPNGAKATGGTQLNIIDSDIASCSKGQREVTWGQTSDVLSLLIGQHFLPSDGTFHNIGSMAVPQGFFVVSATVTLIPGGASVSKTVTCVVTLDNLSILGGGATMTVDPGTIATMPILGRFNSGGNVGLECASTPGGVDDGIGVSVDAFLVATKFGG
jgi:hypothetical protein